MASSKETRPDANETVPVQHGCQSRALIIDASVGSSERVEMLLTGWVRG